MTRDLFRRYIWLVETIYSSGRITFEEIADKWKRSSLNNGTSLVLRTFHNHRAAIEELFGIRILCNRTSGNHYYIDNEYALKTGGMESWLLNTFSVSNAIQETRNLSDRVVLEDIPSGNRFLTSFVEMMKENCRCTIEYQSFNSCQSRMLTISPYCLKLFRRRWYVLALENDSEELHIYSLDRMKSVTLSMDTFDYPLDFSPQDYFYNSFGIMHYVAAKPEYVEIKVQGVKRNYIRMLPLHHSQKELVLELEYSVFQYYISPTYDFCQELLSHGKEIEVLSPSWFRRQIAETISVMNDFYK
ncbi:WYL domain-containing protein [Bacteroides sp. AM10-21B]|nr:WYL domain-containing protein [Bacteroides sp. AM10-21B]